MIEAIPVILRHHILILVLEDDLAIPTEETESLRALSLSIDGIPIMMIPVRIAGILVNEHIVDESIYIEQRFQFFIAVIVSGFGRSLYQLVPTLQITFAGLNMVAASNSQANNNTRKDSYLQSYMKK